MAIDAIAIRPAVPGDAVELAEIERAASSYPWSLAQMISSVHDVSEQGLVILEGQAVLGFCLYKQVLDEASLMNIAVSPERQGEGLGGKLLDATLSEMRASSVERCLLEVRVGNPNAVALYRSRGFTEDGLRKKYYPAESGREDALLMSRTLTGEV